MSIISYIKRIFRIKPKISKIKVFYIKAFKAYNFTEDFIRVLQMMNFDERNAFVRTFENTVVYIILKKDNIERNLNKQIVNLKSEVNSLNTRIKGFEKDCAGDITIIETLRTEVKHLNESIRTKNEQIDAATIQVKANHDKYVKEHAICDSLKSKCDYYKKLMWIFALVCALSCSAFISVII